MMQQQTLGTVVHGFFVDHLAAEKRASAATVRSYRDGLRLFLKFVARDRRRRITGLDVEDLTFERVLAFLDYLERERDNHIRTRNQRLTILRAFFAYLAQRAPEMLSIAERVAQIGPKRVAPPEPHHLDRDELSTLFAEMPADRRDSLRDSTLLLFLYNTGARAQETSDVRVRHLELGPRPYVQLHGKGDKWRQCPLWTDTANQLSRLLESAGTQDDPDAAVFRSGRGGPLTRFGIYKIVRRHGRAFDGPGVGPQPQRVTPHVFRHTTAVHMLESGVDINVIRGWLGHANLTSTNRYAEVTAHLKEAALEICEPPNPAPQSGFSRQPRWKSDEALLKWLDTL
jgi:site-specific recombinase XerD